MPDSIQAPQGTEQKLVFRSEQDRLSAIDALDTTPPKGGNLDDWRREQDAKQDAIEAAAIDPNFTPGQQPPAPGQESDWYKAENWTINQNGQTVTIGRDEIPEEMRNKNVSNAKELVQELLTNHRYNQTKTGEYQKTLGELQSQIGTMTKKMSDYEKQIEEAKKASAGSPPPQSALPSETEIGTIQKELSEIHESLDKMDADDPENAPMMRKAIRLQGKLQDMKDKIHESRFNQFDEERKRIKEESDRSRSERERQEKDQREQQARESLRTKMHQTIDGFTEKTKDLKLSKPFKQVESEYSEWATDIAATYFGVTPQEVDAPMAEKAIQHFLNRTPAFMTKLQDTGKLKRTPTDLRKYLITTELYMMMNGQELDSQTGKWVQKDYRFDEMEDAMERWKRKNGLKYQDMVSAANKAEEELMRVMNPPGIAEQIPAGMGPQAQRDMSKMSKEQALNVMDSLEKQAQLAGSGDVDEWIETLSRRNPGDERVLNYNKAEETLYAVPGR